MSEKNENAVPEGSIVREDGCICPPPEPVKPKCQKLQTCPYDPRFPNMNQTNHCFFSFVHYQKCARLLGDYPGCVIFYRCYRALCPRMWCEKWFEQMEKGIFPYKIYPPSPIIYPDHDKMSRICLEDEEEEEPPDIC